MPNEFILQQTSHPEKKYNSKTLIGNWYEERCEPKSKYSTFYQEQKFEKNQYNVSKLTQESFMKCSQNWLNFQKNQTNHFQTNNQQEFKNPKDQYRTSEIKKFIIKKGVFEKNPQQMSDYRSKWTSAPHFFDRTYLGQQK
ncbi:unnamed protein product [Paramecium sonneborni]|uniref:Uncharacterized protein n=1 Tax=Paramecium sonneborni TaxID=65129 RepID=A0A8S1N7M4_9CILI|nr:unnamed protein product [Paramecium sonneborni]